MSDKPTPKKPHKKDAKYMRRAYLYTALLLILGLIGGILLADRIITAEQQMNAEPVEQQQESEQPDPNQGIQPPTRE